MTGIVGSIIEHIFYLFKHFSESGRFLLETSTIGALTFPTGLSSLMPDYQTLLLAVSFLVIAFMYSAVGQAGGTGYLAVMALASLSPEVMKPTALVLNILVAAIAAYTYTKAGCFSWQRFWPFAVTSIPFAFLGGSLRTPERVYQVLVGAVLLYAAYRLVIHNGKKIEKPRPYSIPLALLIGAGVGFLAGITGIGGGIYLAPILILLGWAEFGQVAGITAAFILVNSISGFAGNLAAVRFIPPQMPYWIISAALGGITGAVYGSRQLKGIWLVRLLAVILAIGGLKMLLT